MLIYNCVLFVLFCALFLCDHFLNGDLSGFWETKRCFVESTGPVGVRAPELIARDVTMRAAECSLAGAVLFATLRLLVIGAGETARTVEAPGPWETGGASARAFFSRLFLVLDAWYACCEDASVVTVAGPAAVTARAAVALRGAPLDTPSRLEEPSAALAEGWTAAVFALEPPCLKGLTTLQPREFDTPSLTSAELLAALAASTNGASFCAGGDPPLDPLPLPESCPGLALTEPELPGSLPRCVVPPGAAVATFVGTPEAPVPIGVNLDWTACSSSRAPSCRRPVLRSVPTTVARVAPDVASDPPACRSDALCD